MIPRAAITVLRSPDEVQRLWSEHAQELDAEVTFKPAPGDRGTEVHVNLGGRGGLFAAGALAKAKDRLRRFKQLAETGEIPRSDAVPEGELVERKFKQRPAQPLEEVAAR
jgi:hypothetical protein